MKNLFKPINKKQGFGFAASLLFYMFLDKYFITAALTKGRSMEPTILDSEVVIIDRFFYKYIKRFHLKKHDIVVVEF